MPFKNEEHNKIQKDVMLDIREKILGFGEKSFRKNYYPELQDRKEKLESLLRSAPIGIGIIVDDNIVEVNEALCKMMGYQEKELIGKNIEIFFLSKEEFETLKKGKYQNLIDKHIFTMELKWKPKSGDPLTVLLSCSPLDEKELSKGITFTVVDITDRKKSEEILYLEKERLIITLQSIGDGVIATDKKGEVVLINPVAERLTGWTMEEGKGRKLKEIFKVVNGKSRMQSNNAGIKAINNVMDSNLNKFMILFSRNGGEKMIAHSAAPIKDQQGQTQGVVLVFRDVTEERERQKDIIRLSYFDKLTGLFNRSYFEEIIKELDTNEQLPLSIVMGDINGLKLTNDVFGHQEGDKLLQSVAKIIEDSCREQDIVARWGGDEFVILLPKTSEDETNKIVRRISMKCQKSGNEKIKTSISLGHATKKKPQENIMKLLKKAEDIMYQHKLLESHSLRSGIVNSIKNTLSEKSHETEEHAERLKDISRNIGKAMNLSELQLYELELLAVLHDIGKIIIRDSILNKPGKLNEEEWMEMKRHPEIGYRIVQSVPELSQIAEYILTHHERWDGNGYPRGLKGEEIPLLSRIISVADAYDAITNNRPYKKAQTKQFAIEELLNNSGTQFDPDVVRVFLDKVAIQL